MGVEAELKILVGSERGAILVQQSQREVSQHPVEIREVIKILTF